MNVKWDFTERNAKMNVHIATQQQAIAILGVVVRNVIVDITVVNAIQHVQAHVTSLIKDAI